MKLRRFGLRAILAFGILAWPLAVEAQSAAKVPRIGILFSVPTDPPSAARILEPFRQGLRERNYVEGQNVAIEYRLGGRGDQLHELATELVQHQVDVIVAVNTPAAKAAQHATRTIPIVANMGDAVEMGLAPGLAAPGGNVTGVSTQFGGTAGKRLELLKEAVPKASRVAVLWNAANPNKALEWKETQVAAQALGGLTLQSVEVRTSDDFGRAFSALTRGRADALITIVDGLTIMHRRQIVDFTTRTRLPMMAAYRDFVEAGGLLSYGIRPRDLYRHLAVYVDKILKGAKPADLPIEQSTTFELVISLKTAKTLGLTIPPSLLLRADQVIE